MPKIILNILTYIIRPPITLKTIKYKKPMRKPVKIVQIRRSPTGVTFLTTKSIPVALVMASNLLLN